MAVVGFFHHVGTFLLLVATALLIVTTITSPVVNDLSLLRVTLTNSTGSIHDSAITFGTFGWCVVNAKDGNDYCSPSRIGYRPAEIITDAEDMANFSDASDDTTRALTKVMILHPISTGVCFIAFMLTLGAGVVGSFLASLAALLSFLLTVVVVITDFVLFSVIKGSLRNDGLSGRANYGTGIWTLLVAGICTLLAAIVVFFSCCSARMHRRRRSAAVKEPVVDGYGTPVRRRRFGIF